VLKNSILLILLLAFVAGAGHVQGTPAVLPPPPFGPTPSPAQLRWHKAEYLMFIHWGMKTFHPNGDHMGTGTEDPKTFNPAQLDTAQWAKVAKEAGFKGIIFTTKHHDGFCNWNTATTDHCVRSAPWKEGKGDVVKDLIEACRKAGIYFGFYVSLRDNHYEAAVSRNYAGYNDYYFRQVEELSKNYGMIDEYWFDGYAADNVKIDYARLATLIKTCQPEAVVYDSFTMAKYLPDRCLRWPGAHGGVGADQVYVNQLPGAPSGTLGWYPNEGSLILQGNWFHCGSPAVSVETMKEYYLQTVGHGVTPIMNVPPNQDGLIDADTVAKLREFKAWVDVLHTNDLARIEGVKVSDAGHRGGAAAFAAARAMDGNYDSYFATDDGVTTATIEVALPRARKINGFILQEYIPLGQRVEAYSIECRVDGAWQEVFAGNRIGYQRIILEGHTKAPQLAFAEGNLGSDKSADHVLKNAGADGKAKFPVADAVRLKIRKAAACPLINNFQIIGE
jgi:alpha-L-fucosidase